MKTIEIHQKTCFLAEIGRILMKNGPSDAEFNFLLTGTNENCTTTQKTIKTKEIVIRVSKTPALNKDQCTSLDSFHKLSKEPKIEFPSKTK